MKELVAAALRKLGLGVKGRILAHGSNLQPEQAGFEIPSIDHSLKEYLTQIGGCDSPRVLCVDPSARTLTALTILSIAGAKVSAISGASSSPIKRSPGISLVADELGRWMISHLQTRLLDWDVIILGEHISADSLNLLRGRISPRTLLLVQPNEERRPYLDATQSPERELGGVEIYVAPPASFVDPADGNPRFSSLDTWLRCSQPLRVPPRMPSGRLWPKISIVTVTLNQAAYLEETLRSVLMQGYPNLEYIVLDGLSTDETPSILAKYRKDLAFCASERDEGQSDALNKGLSLATGDILAWLNSDDRYLPETLLRVAIAFDTYDADVVTGGCALTRNDSRDIYKTHHSYFPVGTVSRLPAERLLDVDGSWLKGDFFWQPEVFWNRRIWERSGSYIAKNLYYSMDYDLWVRMAQANARIVHVPDALAVFRFHDAQKTSGEDVLPYIPELRRVSQEYLKTITR